MRLLYILPIIVIVAAVTAALKADEGRGFAGEFAKAAGSLLGGFAVLAAVVLALGRLL